MTFKEKQEYFYQMAIELATAQNISMVKEYEEQLKKETKKYEEQLEDSYLHKLKVTKEELLREKNSKVSFQSLELRHEFNELKENLKEELFEQVKVQVLEFCITDAYKENLITQINSAIKLGEGLTCNVKVMSRDYDFVVSHQFPDTVNIIKSDVDFWGGFEVDIVEKQMVINHTFAFEFEECKQHFQFHLPTAVEVEQ